jgi:hypothetical protein
VVAGAQGGAGTELARQEDGHAAVSAFFARPAPAVVGQFAILLPVLLDHADEAQAAIEAR